MQQILILVLKNHQDPQYNYLLKRRSNTANNGITYEIPAIAQTRHFQILFKFLIFKDTRFFFYGGTDGKGTEGKSQEIIKTGMLGREC